MEQCTKCLGEGIIGNGDVPHLKQGHLVTCDACNGTGSVDANAQFAAEITVDNSIPESTPRRGILSWLGK